MNKPLVAIVIVNWNSLEFTLECLATLKNCGWQNLIQIVVDNGSQEKPEPSIKERYPDVHVIENKRNLGFAEGNNVGIRAALDMRAEYILLLNNDTIVESGFLDPLVKELEGNPEVGAVSPLILFTDPSDSIWFAGEYPIMMGIHGKKPYFRKSISFLPHNESYEVKCLSGCAMMMSRHTIEEVGMLDPSYFTYCEDIDYSKRIRDIGKKMMLVPSSCIRHKVSGSSGGANNPISLYLMGRGRVMYLRKHATWYVWFLFMPFALGQMLMDLKRGGWRHGLKSVKSRLTGYIHGFSGTLQIPENF